MKNIRKPLILLFRIILPFSFLLIASSVSIFGQATKGTLRGTITDPNGQVISGAIVIATNDATHISTQTTTTSDGLYVIPELAPGQYSVSAESAGFSKRLMKNITVSLGLATNLSVELAVGAPTEVVSVTSGGEELALQRDQSQISTTFDNRKIQDLPSNGAASGLDTIALLAPGITTANSGGVNTNGTGLSVNGNRARANNFQIDGADNNDLVIGGPANFLDNQEAVQEYQIITNNYSA